jgi:hypothetical protein
MKRHTLLAPSMPTTWVGTGITSRANACARFAF